GPAVSGADDPVVGPLGADDVQGPAVRRGAVQAAAEQPGYAYRDARDRAEPGADEVRAGVGGARFRIGVPVAGDLLAGDRVEEPVAVAGHHHDEVLSAVGVDGEPHTEKAPDGSPAVHHRLPRFGSRHDGGGEIALAQLLLVLRDQVVSSVRSASRVSRAAAHVDSNSWRMISAAPSASCHPRRVPSARTPYCRT